MSSRPPAGPPAKRFARTSFATVAASLAVTLVVGLCQAPAAQAAEPKPYTPTAATPIPAVAVKPVQARKESVLKPPTPPRPAPVWPEAGTQVIEVPATGTARAGKAPVGVTRAAKSPTRVRVEMLDRAATARAGVEGVALRVGRADGLTERAEAQITLDYRAFATAYGADWSSRLRLVRLPECALTTPAKPACAGTPLKSTNNAKSQSLSAQVPVDGSQTLLAATAAPSGPAGNYAASTLNPSSSWAQGGNTGAFTWSYPMRTPPGLGGPTPTVALSYSSQSVDGMHAASNNQPSWIGEGFDGTFGGFIERRYKPCSDDMNSSANNDRKTGDLCWETSNATLALPGHSGELIFNSSEGRWHLRDDDGSRIQRVTGGVNGDNDGEHWVVTTTDGVQYWFGLNRLPGWTANKPVTNSTLTVPVFGNDPNEPCHASTFAASDCAQAWRWNLDYVIDPVGNSMSYWYQKEGNKYSRNLDNADAADYDRAAWLDHIDYGTRKISGTDSILTTPAPMRIDFTEADRCLSDCGTHNAVRWPDVPWDESCTGTTCTDDYSPTFWSTKRLASITTQVRSGTTYANVERWTFTHSFPDPGDGTRAGLWLEKISHAGLVGTTTTVPDVEFTWEQKSNRVDTIDFAAAMKWMRISKIRTETGGSIDVTYSEQDCKPEQARPAPETNTRLCYPVYWTPDGYDEPVMDWFNKYVVKTIFQNDNTGGAPPNGSPRVAYSYDYLDGAAWRYTDDDGLIQKKYKTWSNFRGYSKVAVTVGDESSKAYTETRYFRGMNGDRAGTSGTKSVSVDGIADEDWYAGMARETTTFNGPNGAVVAREVSTPWASAATATRTVNNDTVTARVTEVGTTMNYTVRDGGRSDLVTKTVTTYDSYGLPTAVDDLGQDGVAGDEQCTKTTYVRTADGSDPALPWIMDREKTVQTYAVKCADIGGTLTEQDIIGETRYIYDDVAYGAAPKKGLVAETQQMSAWNNGNPTFIAASKAKYDDHGRVTQSTDIMNANSTVSYTPASDGPVTATSTKNPMLHETKTTLAPAWGLPITVEDPNGKKTERTYDGLGRVTAVWAPGRDKATQTATEKYAYTVSASAATAVATSRLNAAENYVTSYQLYDGLLRLRQTQAPSPSGGRIITESFFDTAGRNVITRDDYHVAGAPTGTLIAPVDPADVKRQTRTVYDGASRPTAQIFQPSGIERWRTTLAYGGDRVDTTPPTGGTATSAVTDARGRTVELRQYQGATPTPYTAGSWNSTTYTFDRRGNQTENADALGNKWTYTYDIRGRKTQIADPDKGQTTLTYNNAGNVLTTTDAAGKTIAYSYDPLGRKRAAYDTRVNGTLRAQWVYDTIVKGYLSYTSRWVGSAQYQVRYADYNDRYQPGSTLVSIPSTETGLAGDYTFTNGYNIDGSILSTTMPSTNGDLPSETLTYTYNDLGQPTTMSTLYGGQNSTYVTGTDYNALGELDQVQLSTGTGGNVFVKYGREFDTGRLTKIRVDRDQVAPYILADTRYDYDKAGNVTKMTDVAPDPVDDTQCFGYDNLRRLTEAWTPASGDCEAAPAANLLGGPASYWLSWEYNKISNRTRQTVHSTSGNAVTDYQYPASGAASVRPHALTSTTGATTGTYTYDNTGNMLTRPTTSAGTQTMTWDPEGHLATSTDTTGQTTYIYDADGNRLIRRDPTGRTLYLPGQEIRYDTTTAAKTCTRYYTYAGSTVASRTVAGLTWLSSDHQGTATIALKAVGQQATVRRQTPYGTPRGASATWPNDKTFVGGTSDNTGLTHLGAREYDASAGRFISVDPIQDMSDPQQWNAYSYANGSPITLSDPSGERPDDKFYGETGAQNREKNSVAAANNNASGSRGASTRPTPSPSPWGDGGTEHQKEWERRANEMCTQKLVGELCRRAEARALAEGASYVPYVGAAGSGYLVKDAIDRGDYVAAGIEVLGAIPFGKLIAKFSKAVKKGLPKTQLQWNEHIGNAYRDHVADWFHQNGYRAITDGIDKKRLTFWTPHGYRYLDIEVSDKNGNILGWIETKSGNEGVSAKQRKKDAWLRKHRGMTIDYVYDDLDNLLY